MKNDFSIESFFVFPIYKIRVDPNSYDKEKIINDILYNKSLKNTRQNKFENSLFKSFIHHSYQDFDNVNFRAINYEKLVSIYSEIFDDFFNKEINTIKTFNFEFEIINYTAMSEGQYFPAHNHPTDDFAAVHYLNFKDDHVPTLFHNPATFAPFLKYMRPDLANILDTTHKHNQYMWQHFAYKVEEDDMLIFPSALDHEIKAQGPTKEPRITIATNLKIVPPTQEKHISEGNEVT